GLAFFTWLQVVAKRVGIDYMRAHPDYIDRRRSRKPGVWIVPAPLTSSRPGKPPSITRRGTAAELLRHADVALPEPQRRALEPWIQSQSYGEIARHLDLGVPAAAARLVRAALERLRRRFRTGS